MKKHSPTSKKKQDSKTPAKKTPAKKRDPLAPYRTNARKLIDLYFNPDIPAFVEDLLSSYFTRLEDSTQIFWNEREVLEILLPLWLQNIDGDDAHVLSCKHPVYIDALHESLSCNAPDDDYRRPLAERDDLPQTDADKLQAELLVDAQAIARILNSPHVPTDIKDKLGDALNNLINETNTSHELPEVLRVAYPLAVRRLTEGSASDGSSE